MSTVGQKERVTQDRVVRLFEQQLGYRYLGDWEKRAGNSHIEEDLVRRFLKSQHTPDALIDRALHQLKEKAQVQTQTLYDANQAVYELLRYGVKVKPETGEQSQTVQLVNWAHPEANDFALAEEVSVPGKHGKRPDIVLYLNGIAVGVLELKRSTVSVSEGIRQNLDNQKKVFIEPFFSAMQLVMAGNDTEGLRYGTIQTPEKYYLTWKEDEESSVPAQEHLLDTQLAQLCNKKRLLDLLLNFVVYDKGIKKLCRPNQYFGVKAARRAVREEKGGIIWHTQGSGKSLTMVWLAKWILENVEGSRVLIITDRTELDQQIEGTFLGVGESITRTASGAELLGLLAQPNPRLMCSLIHKFGAQDEGDISAFVQEVQQGQQAGFQPYGRFFVFVDECHRTQSGALHQAMTSLLPGAVMIGFTGTPLLKADKARSIEVFGPYIHTYRYDQAVRDGVVLDLKYEARDIDQHLTSTKKIDEWFALKTKDLTEAARSRLKQRWGTLQKVLSSQDRLNKIVADILLDMEKQPRLESGQGNAMLVVSSIYQACKVYELFLDAGFEKCAIVTSYKPSIADTKGEETGEGLTERLQQYETYIKMLNGKSPEDFEKEVKERFIKQPGQLRLLIVVDKLLTGFDAPSATYLYIDKTMRDHALFQAICRVNRLDGEEKEYGYVVDYKDLFGSLGQAFKDYTSGALDGYDQKDVQGLLQDRLATGRARLEERLEELRALCEPVPPPRDSQAHLHYFCGDPGQPEEANAKAPTRLLLYKLTGGLVRAYADIANELEQAGYTAAEGEMVRQQVAHFQKLSDEVKLASADYIDLKRYEPAMRHLIDTYIRADESEVVSAFEDLTLIDLLVQQGPAAVDQLPGSIKKDKTSVAETIENNLRKVITNEQPLNPAYYEQMSVLLDALIKERKEKALEYAAYLQKLAELAQQIKQVGGSQHYPASLATTAQRSLYDNLGQDEMLALRVDETVRRTRKDGWRGNLMKERELKRAVRTALGTHLVDEAHLAQLMELIRNQADY
ncbi:restriction endonuclease subunit R [Deinococcus irradiatisoli]|uniref:Type I restriction enzyme endonuclease subunit n=1 Tax=Deinococcus irradiatisoli TaxID=2202254 RepID=A0A2Z3JSP4_9DEIO|nr:HsdR family type I site-specific deoxyribonuclease [Deinococcus irradiatisoli]AWN24268.1 restriction endonuclease subunit R [Deinococcus irradiatisoli]